jgi:hypothetical protein
MAAFLTGLLAHDGQKILWMTDHDAICANREMHDTTLRLFQRVLSLYTAKQHTFPLLGGALPFPERSVEMLDLLSVTDIVAGALDQLLTQTDSVDPAEIKLKPGCERVLEWLAHDGIGLKKMNVILRLGNGTINGSTLEFGLENAPKDTTLIRISV